MGEKLFNSGQQCDTNGSYSQRAGPEDCRITGEGTYTKGIHIVSDVPIVAYAHTYGVYSSGATMLLPVETYQLHLFFGKC